MPHIRYTYAGADANCVPAMAGVMAGAGVPGPNLLGLSGLAGAALPGLAGIAAGGLGAMPAAPGLLPYSWAALAAASTIIGAFPPGVHPAYELNWRVANLRIAARTAGGRLARTPVLPRMERQERIHLSYAMGMNLAAYAARAANFTFPMHFTRFRAVRGGLGVGYTQNPAFAAADLPDIVFTDPINGTCQVWEAKGYSGVGAAGITAVAAAAASGPAMQQARRLATLLVPGFGLVAPNCYVASVARLHPASFRWHLHVWDPPNGGLKRDRDEDGDVDKEAFYREYYRPYVEMVADSDQTVSFGGITYSVAPIPGTSVLTGLDARIERLFTTSPAKRRRTDNPNRLPADIVAEIEGYLVAGYPQDAGNPNRFVSREGIFTEAAEDDMTQPPA